MAPNPAQASNSVITECRTKTNKITGNQEEQCCFDFAKPETCSPIKIIDKTNQLAPSRGTKAGDIGEGRADAGDNRFFLFRTDVLVCLLLIAIILAVLFWFFVKRKKNDEPESESEEDDTYAAQQENATGSSSSSDENEALNK